MKNGVKIGVINEKIGENTNEIVFSIKIDSEISKINTSRKMLFIPPIKEMKFVDLNPLEFFILNNVPFKRISTNSFV